MSGTSNHEPLRVYSLRTIPDQEIAMTIIACDVDIEEGVLNFTGRFEAGLGLKPTVATVPALTYIVTSEPFEG